MAQANVNLAATKSVAFAGTTCAERGGKCALVCAFVAILVALLCMAVYRIVKECTRGTIRVPQIVDEAGLAHLGTVTKKGVAPAEILSSLKFTAQTEAGTPKTVLLHPTNSKVKVGVVADALEAQASEEGVVLKIAPALEESVFTLFNGTEADAVIVVVEEGISALPEIDEILRDFAQAQIPPSGFIYLSH